jgi:hypothetical protein
MLLLIWQVFWLSLVDTFPLEFQQWSADSTCELVTTRRLYSYGDSTGFTPDFPFHPDAIGNQIIANVVTGELRPRRVFNNM